MVKYIIDSLVLTYIRLTQCNSGVLVIYVALSLTARICRAERLQGCNFEFLQGGVTRYLDWMLNHSIATD